MCTRLLVCLFVVHGCATPAPAVPPSAPESAPRRTAREPVACGPHLQCGPDEVCIVQCECCGVSVAPEDVRASYRCEPLPEECLEEDADPAACPRTLARPCA